MNIQSSSSQIYSNRMKSIAYVSIFMILIALLASVLGAKSGMNLSYALTWSSFSFIYVIFSFFFGSKLALRMNRAVLLDPVKDEKIYTTVRHLCSIAGMNMPKLYKTPEAGMNAFATGATQAQASVALTQGLVDNLSDKELEAVIAHELSHLKHGDTQLMLLVMMLSGILSALVHLLQRTAIFAGEEKPSVRLAFFLLGFGISILSLLTQLAISRKREFMADAGAVSMTKNPDAMASALLRLQSGASMEHASYAMAPMYIHNVLPSSMGNLFSTHPSIEARVQAIRQLIP